VVGAKQQGDDQYPARGRNAGLLDRWGGGYHYGCCLTGLRI
jgi:hypothetical protein